MTMKLRLCQKSGQSPHKEVWDLKCGFDEEFKSSYESIEFE